MIMRHEFHEVSCLSLSPNSALTIPSLTLTAVKSALRGQD